jgi:hypothetical protein
VTATGTFALAGSEAARACLRDRHADVVRPESGGRILLAQDSQKPLRGARRC